MRTVVLLSGFVLVVAPVAARALLELRQRAARAERAALEACFAFAIALLELETKVGREVRP